MKKQRGKIQYMFENIMSKGIISQICFLGIISIIVGLVVGILAFAVKPEDGLLIQFWNSFMHILGLGDLASNYGEKISYNVFMIIAVLCGILVTSGLFGIIATSLDNLMADMRKGKSKVIEKNHTTIIGYNEEIFTLINELLAANENHKDKCIVIAGTQDKEEMEAELLARIGNFKGTKIVCRSGNIDEEYMYELCSIEDSKSIIINIKEDVDTIKILLAVAKYLRKREWNNSNLHIVASVLDEENVEPAKLAGDGMAEIICTRDSVARIIAHTCRQKGLSKVVYELFNYKDSEIYFEDVPDLEGKTFKEALNAFTNAVALGIHKAKGCLLNPPMDTVFEKGDKIVLFEEDDGVFVYNPEKKNVIEENLNPTSSNEKYADKLLILGINEKIGTILEEYNECSLTGAEVVIVSDKRLELDNYKVNNLKIEHIKSKKHNKKIIESILDKGQYTVLVLSNTEVSYEEADKETMLILIYLRNLAKKNNVEIPITTEMRLTKNQNIAENDNIQDFVISADLVNLLMTQVSENRELVNIFAELLTNEGSEIYMKPARNYVVLNKEVSFYDITEAAAIKSEVALGYRKKVGNSIDIITNPNKETKVILTENDYVVVIAEE